ncbi:MULTISPECIES: mycothiol synthase [unclassified Luteococcus]|uniref:mycothiol synthase n=1 Tax=unclassified Luteococcus TaxID=2639923 RepID=UPI00313AD113
MNTPITRTGALTPPQRAAVDKLVATVTEHDQVRPLNEAASFALAGKGHAVHWLAHRQGELAGYAQCDRENHSVQLLVAPQHRRAGVALALVQEITRVEQQPTWWAFGNLPGARALAGRIGATLTRELLIMERDLAANPPSREEPPSGIVVRPFEEADAQALVEVNEDAFVDHPEQAEMSLEDFWMRSGEDWFDPAGLLVAIDDETGAFVGFHWTKTECSDPSHPDEPIGEVYVIGVHPDHGGRGIGRALLAAGLAHLADKGVNRVRLYVEASSERVVKMYESAKFVVVTRDASYTS